YRGRAWGARSADGAYRHDCRGRCRRVLRPGLAECGGRGGTCLAARSAWQELAHRSDEPRDRPRGRGGLLIVLGFSVLLLPSGLTALGGDRDVVLAGYGAPDLPRRLGL